VTCSIFRSLNGVGPAKGRAPVMIARLAGGTVRVDFFPAGMSSTGFSVSAAPSAERTA
jgi:hypothetical protein